MNILDMDATELAEHIKAWLITSIQAVETYISHLSLVQPMINCLTQERFNEARQEAKAIDERVQEGDIDGKLLGVPMSVKDNFHVKGMATTSGLTYRKNIIETEDADVIARLKQEGAVILGKTNTPSLCFCQETDNKLHGRTNNPWDLTRTAGGSSGGEGALIAAGGAAIGIGADIGGSIRFPSHFNGIVGFKSGNSQISSKGNFPAITYKEQERMLGIGAMAKSVRDAQLLHSILTGQQLSYAD